MYDCFNVVTAKEGVGEAVLIRAIEPVIGVESMLKRRSVKKFTDVSNGPGKLVLALGINRAHNWSNLMRGPIRIHSRNSFPELYPKNMRPRIVATTRIGISSGADLPLRFYINDSEFVSRK